MLEVRVYAYALWAARVWLDPEPPPLIPGTRRQLIPLPYVLDMELDEVRVERAGALWDARLPGREGRAAPAHTVDPHGCLRWSNSAEQVAATQATMRRWVAGAGDRMYTEGSVREGQLALGVFVAVAGGLAARLPPGRGNASFDALRAALPAGATVMTDNLGVVGP
ncbi:hypothetical protein HK101_005428, partial [Irineochytrium annulatum]